MRKTPTFMLLIIFGYIVLFPRFALASLFNSCIYTEEDVPVPQELVNGALVVTKNVHQVTGLDPEYSCLSELGKIDRELVGTDMETSDPSGWTKYFTSNGRTITDIPQGYSFRVNRVVRVIKHGWQTLDSGPGPIYFLVLTDEKDTVFKIATVMVGQSHKTQFLKYVSPSASFMLNPSVFESYDGSTSGTNFKFEHPLSVQ